MSVNRDMDQTSEELENIKRSRSGYEANLTKKTNALKRKMKDITKYEDAAIAKADFDAAHEKCMRICNDYRDSIPENGGIWMEEKAGAIFKCSQMMSKKSALDEKYVEYLEKCEQVGIQSPPPPGVTGTSVEFGADVEVGGATVDPENPSTLYPNPQPNTHREAFLLQLKAQQIERQVKLETRKIDLELKLLKAKNEAIEAELLAQDASHFVGLDHTELSTNSGDSGLPLPGVSNPVLSPENPELKHIKLEPAFSSQDDGMPNIIVTAVKSLNSDDT